MTIAIVMLFWFKSTELYQNNTVICRSSNYYNLDLDTYIVIHGRLMFESFFFLNEALNLIRNGDESLHSLGYYQTYGEAERVAKSEHFKFSDKTNSRWLAFEMKIMMIKLVLQ